MIVQGKKIDYMHLIAPKDFEIGKVYIEVETKTNLWLYLGEKEDMYLLYNIAPISIDANKMLHEEIQLPMVINMSEMVMQSKIDTKALVGIAKDVAYTGFIECTFITYEDEVEKWYLTNKLSTPNLINLEFPKESYIEEPEEGKAYIKGDKYYIYLGKTDKGWEKWYEIQKFEVNLNRDRLERECLLYSGHKRVREMNALIYLNLTKAYQSTITKLRENNYYI